MYYFSEQFTEGLRTKSEGFQDKFFEITDEICGFIDEEDKKRDFQKYIEKNHSFNKPGNILYSSKAFFGGKPGTEKLTEKMQKHILRIFDDSGAGEAMEEVPHIIICVRTSDEDFSEEEMELLKNTINLERMLRGKMPAVVTTILNSAEIGTEMFIACIK